MKCLTHGTELNTANQCQECLNESALTDTCSGGYEIIPRSQWGVLPPASVEKYTDNYHTSLNGVRWVRLDYINKRDQVEQEATKQLEPDQAELVKAFKNYIASHRGGKKICGHEFTCVCAGDLADEVLAKYPTEETPNG